jgi:hypothetical protein
MSEKLTPFLELVTAQPSRDQTHSECVYRPLQFQKRSQYFFDADDETLSVALRVHNPDRSPLRTNG